MQLTTIDRKRLKLTQTMGKKNPFPDLPIAQQCCPLTTRTPRLKFSFSRAKKPAQNDSRQRNPEIFLAQAELQPRNAAEQLNYQQLKHSRMYSFLIEYTRLQAINKIKRTFRMNKNIPLNKIYSH